MGLVMSAALALALALSPDLEGGRDKTALMSSTILQILQYLPSYNAPRILLNAAGQYEPEVHHSITSQ
jgi:hypothetical protein